MILVLGIVVIRTLVGSSGPPPIADRAGREVGSTHESAPTSESAPTRESATEAEPAVIADTKPATPAVALAPAAVPTNSSQLSTAQIVVKCEPSVAFIKGKVSSGTGFVIKRGVVATNAHVIEEEFLSGLEVRFPGAPEGKQGPLQAQLLYEDRKRDLAFLAVKTDLPPLPLAPNYAFVKGEDVTVIGNPGMGDDVVLENAISKGVMSSKTVIEGMNYYQMSIAINHGNSGGPVFDSSGRVIGVATLKASKAEAMGFCIPVEELAVATREVGRAHPEMIARHRAVTALKTLTLGGVLYVVGIATKSGKTDVPAEEAAKLHETVNTLDQNMFSLVDNEVSQLQNDAALSPGARRSYQDLSANLKVMKQLYTNTNHQMTQLARLQSLASQHHSLIVSIRDELKIEVPAKLLAVLQAPAPANQPQVVVVDMMPPQMQPGFRRRGPGMGMGPRMGPRGPGNVSPGQALHNQMQRQMQQMQQQMRGAQNRGRNVGPTGPP